MSDTPTEIVETRRKFRAQMAVTERWAYFDHAAVSPTPRPTRAAIERWLDEAGGDGGPAWMGWAQRIEQTRRTSAALLGATPAEIAFTQHTTGGISLVAQGLDWRPGDNVVTLDDEFPANIYPWLSLQDKGVETRFAPTERGRVDLDAVRSLCDERTRVVSVSWVAYLSGHRRDLTALAEIAKQHDAWFVVDAIQGVGALPFDVKQTPADVVALNGQKWQMGPEGAAYAYVCRERLDDLRVAGLGWNSMVDPFNFKRIEIRLRDDAARFEAGTRNMSGLIGLGASQAMLLELGVDNIAAAILDLTDEACRRLAELGAEVLSPRGADERSGIVQFQLPGADGDAVRSHCLERGVALACRSGSLRISPHGYNTPEDLDRLFDALQTF
ncbi:MAG: aminotransferase class V-fold PLP-dependent enzyme [Planctomycetales bacterium]|nr:aminotransferase class V-fold PLP-dependent enzyme [Planctomycetales bacterium]